MTFRSLVSLHVQRERRGKMEEKERRACVVLSDSLRLSYSCVFRFHLCHSENLFWGFLSLGYLPKVRNKKLCGTPVE